MSENSHVKEHCSVYALSDKTEIEFRQPCDHEHDERCVECEAIASTMKDIEELLSRVGLMLVMTIAMRHFTYCLQLSVPSISGNATS